MRLMSLGCALAFLSLFPACDDAGLDPAGEVSFRPSTGGGGTGGWYLNTNAIGANAFSELDTTGALHDGVRLKGVEIKEGSKYTKLDRVWSEDGELVGKKGPVIHRGAAFLGSRWALEFAAGTFPENKQTMWVADYDASGSTHRYTFEYSAKNGAPTPVCADDEDEAGAAVVFDNLSVDPISGDVTERLNTLYLGCVSGAVGKAAAWGYTPWELGAADFEAAVRVVRADYCGDGSSWTQAGAALQLADVWQINSFADPSAPAEALWGEQGALCLASPRVGLLSASAITCDGQPLPACDAGANLNTVAGSLFWSRTMAP